MGGNGGVKHAYVLTMVEALKFSIFTNVHIFQCMGKIFLCEISKGTLEIEYKIHQLYIERCDFSSP